MKRKLPLTFIVNLAEPVAWLNFLSLHCARPMRPLYALYGQAVRAGNTLLIPMILN